MNKMNAEVLKRKAWGNGKKGEERKRKVKQQESKKIRKQRKRKEKSRM